MRTLKGVPQPSSICPVGEHGVAVLCKREIRVLDLDEGVFKVSINISFSTCEYFLPTYNTSLGYSEGCYEPKNAILWIA